MNWSALISGSVSILIGIAIFLDELNPGNIFWALFLIGVGIAIILYSDKADKIEKVKK